MPPAPSLPRIVFLDRRTIAPHIVVRRPDFPHEWIEHAETAPDEVVARLEGAAVAIANKVPLRAEALAQLPDLRLIAVAATGTDTVDLAAARARGIVVANIRDYATVSVPEHTFALILALRRNLMEYRDEVQGGRWQREAQFCFFNRPIRDLAGSTLGVVGAGSLGRTVAALGDAFGMNILFASRSTSEPLAIGQYAALADLLRRSDVVTLHLPLTDATRGLIGREQLGLMKPTAILINTARGGIVDEGALLAALQEGRLAGAALDVTAPEPPAADAIVAALARMPNVIVTPHVAWASDGAMQALADQLIANIEAWQRGAPRNVVT
jgi:glycerate dehydrogenase